MITRAYNSTLGDAELRRERRALLNLLGDGEYGAHGDSIENATCLPGTRVELLERIDKWIRGEASTDRVLWIRGMAGRGKSTVASTVAYRWAGRGSYALFHFRRGQNALNGRLVCALMRQLGIRGTPEVRKAILQTIHDNHDIRSERLEEQFEILLAGSLQNVQPSTFPILLVVDALDECSDVAYATKFVKLIDKHSAVLPANVKFLLTTRPEVPLLFALEPRSWHMESLDSVTDVDLDMGRYLQYRLSKLKEDHPRLVDWPPEGSIQTLARLSQGVFQWASTAVQYLDNGSPTIRLKELIAGSTFSGLDNLYRQILSAAFERTDNTSGKRGLLHRALSVLVAAPYPVSLEVMAYIFADKQVLGDETQAEAYSLLRDEVLPTVNSLVFVPKSNTEPIRLMHTSIRDFLIDADRCGKNPYFIDLPQAHSELALACIQLMERDLKKNICQLPNSSKANYDPEIQAAVTKHVPSGLQYCCQSWALHLAEGQRNSDLKGGKPRVVPKDLERFSTHKLLCWLEVMSLMENVGEAVGMAKAAERWARVSWLVQ